MSTASRSDTIGFRAVPLGEGGAAHVVPGFIPIRPRAVWPNPTQRRCTVLIAGVSIVTQVFGGKCLGGDGLLSLTWRPDPSHVPAASSCLLHRHAPPECAVRIAPCATQPVLLVPSAIQNPCPFASGQRRRRHQAAPVWTQGSMATRSRLVLSSRAALLDHLPLPPLCPSCTDAQRHGSDLKPNRWRRLTALLLSCADTVCHGFAVLRNEVLLWMQICTIRMYYTYTRRIRDVYAHTYTTIRIVCGHCAHARLPGCSL